MKIKWLGHSSFLITSSSGFRIITDPYTVGSGLSYGTIKESADAVTVSHDHGDHNNPSTVGGKPVIIKGTLSQEVKGIKFQGFPVFHDESKGKERGADTIYAFTVDGIRIAHMGDLGHLLNEELVKQIGPVDVVLIPVGGYFTIDAAQATKVCDQLKPKVIIPMHFKTPKCGYPIAGVDEFIRGKTSVKREAGSEIEIKTPPAAAEIRVLQPAL
ncbi:MAG: MBL fold metallo-hydrolase [Chloroflexi bacterium]|nr:MBL fold metallo-hydrolase [Chloroflexota bacterium]